jgi:hypothetical protein
MSLRKKYLNLPAVGKKVSNQESTPYCRAARFPSVREAGAAYFRIQKLIDTPEADLSAYRLQIRGVWHVAIVGDAPGQELADELERWLSAGESVELATDALEFLFRWRAEQSRYGPWVEVHYRPGRRFRFGRE